MGEFKDTVSSSLPDVRQRPSGANQPWLSQAMLQIIEERRDLKKSGIQTTEKEDKYKLLCREIQRNCRIDRSQYILNVCEEIEQHQNRNQTHELFRKLFSITLEFKPKTWAVEDENCTLVGDRDAAIKGWKQYCVKLYSGENNNVLHQRAIERHETEPPILRSEVENAMKYLKNNKASGVDEISGEMLKEMGEEGIDFFHALCNRVWSSREWPKD